MKRHSLVCVRSSPRTLYLFALTGAAAALSLSLTARAQTRSTRDTATAYGARLNAKGEPANLNPSRINNRVNSRLETRLSLRVERYRPDITNDAASVFATRMTDNTRVGSDTTLSPLSTATSTSMSQAYEAPQQGASDRPYNRPRPF